MRNPLIGITCFSVLAPSTNPSMPASRRSAANQQYIEAVAEAGGAPVLVPMDLNPDTLAAIYANLDGLLLPGGDDVAPYRYHQDPHPGLGHVDDRRDELELTLATWALRDNLPVLGICRGIQVLAVAAGGTLYQDVPSQLSGAASHDVREHGRDHRCHDITIQPGSRLAQALGTVSTPVNSFHHQAVLDVPPGFSVSATAPDGVIEGIESAGHNFAVGVQCHPEGMWQTTAPEFAGLFREFVAAAARSQRRPSAAAS